ncbi:aromatic amino acid lyase, partial [Myxococcota bacterium]|nr:aromatic amino acid lyase [Myxococcota bacterium]
AAALVSENKSLCFPASVDSIPTCENTEDHVSMGLIAARKTRTVIENAEKIIAIELLNAFQAVHFRAPFHKEMGQGTQAVFDFMNETNGISFVSEDRILAPLIQKTLELVTRGSITELLQSSPGLQ